MTDNVCNICTRSPFHEEWIKRLSSVAGIHGTAECTPSSVEEATPPPSVIEKKSSPGPASSRLDGDNGRSSSVVLVAAAIKIATGTQCPPSGTLETRNLGLFLIWPGYSTSW